MIDLLEEFNLESTEENVKLIAENLKHLKDLQELYMLQQSYPGLKCVENYSHVEEIKEINLPEPPRTLTHLDLNIAATRAEFKTNYSRVLHSTDGFQNYDKFLLIIVHVLYRYSSKGAMYNNFIHREEGRVWLTAHNISTCLTNVMRSNGFENNYKKIEAYLDSETLDKWAPKHIMFFLQSE